MDYAHLVVFLVNYFTFDLQMSPKKELTSKNYLKILQKCQILVIFIY
jgi:hypothetical protein